MRLSPLLILVAAFACCARSRSVDPSFHTKSDHEVCSDSCQRSSDRNKCFSVCMESHRHQYENIFPGMIDCDHWCAQTFDPECLPRCTEDHRRRDAGGGD
jgi:hypothetical protein